MRKVINPYRFFTRLSIFKFHSTDGQPISPNLQFVFSFLNQDIQQAMHMFKVCLNRYEPYSIYVYQWEISWFDYTFHCLQNLHGTTTLQGLVARPSISLIFWSIRGHLGLTNCPRPKNQWPLQLLNPWPK